MPKLRFNTYGFNVGGPVKFKSGSEPKTFFFYNMEWRDLIQGGALRTNVPFTSTYGGNMNEALNFGGLLNTGQTVLHAPFSCQVSTAVQTRFANAGQALSGCKPDPNNPSSLIPDTTKQATFGGNVIAASLLDPNAQALLKAGIFPA